MHILWLTVLSTYFAHLKLVMVLLCVPVCSADVHCSHDRRLPRTCLRRFVLLCVQRTSVTSRGEMLSF